MDFKGIHLEEHSPHQRSRASYDYDWDPDAKCPEFKCFLSDIFSPINILRGYGTEEVRNAMVEERQRTQYILEFFGLCLLGLGVSHIAHALILLGDGANGKSTLLELIETLFPAGLVSGVAPHEWTDKQSVALLRGKRINIVGELPNKDLQETQVYKAVVTGDAKITAKNVYEKPFEFKATAGHIIAANVLGAAGDGSNGWARRNAIITMTRVFSEAEQDKSLPSKLRAEAQGIVALLLRSALDAVQRGRICQRPASSDEAVREWMADSDPVRSWILGTLKLSGDFDHCSTLTPSEHEARLFTQYSTWASADNRRGMSSPTFWSCPRQAEQFVSVNERDGSRAG